MSQDVEQTARDMGWRPKEEFRGDEANWVDAETFVSRGENFLPILRANNKKLADELQETRHRLDEATTLIKSTQASVEDLKKFHTSETARQVEQARKDLITQITAAREAGDTESEIALTEQLADVRAAQREAKKEGAPAPAAAPAAPAQPAEAPEFTAWREANPWFKEKPRLRGLAMGIAEEIRAANPTLVGPKFFEKLSEEMAPHLDEGQPPAKVSGGRPSGSAGAGGSAGSRRTRTYSDLPSDAKASCDEWNTRLVGPGKSFKTIADWQTHYTEQYFAGESA